MLDVADSSIALATPFGPVGIALEGQRQAERRLRRAASRSSARSSRPGRCGATNLHAYVARRRRGAPAEIDGPVTLDSFACPASRFQVAAPRFDAKASFNEAFTSVDGSGRMAITTLVAGANGLANFVGDITYNGSLNDVDGRGQAVGAEVAHGHDLPPTARGSSGGYHLRYQATARSSCAGNYAADSAALGPSMLAGVTQPLAAAAKTPIGPVATSIGNAISRTARNFNSAGHDHAS